MHGNSTTYFDLEKMNSDAIKEIMKENYLRSYRFAQNLCYQSATILDPAHLCTMSNTCMGNCESGYRDIINEDED